MHAPAPAIRLRPRLDPYRTFTATHELPTIFIGAARVPPGPPLALRLCMNPSILSKALAVSTLVGAAVTLSASGCAVDPTEDESTAYDDSASALTRGQAVARADEWVSAKLHYCQAPYHGSNWPQDTACSHYCNRQEHKSWDPYRSDCSGLVSWAWELPAPGRVTGGFAPYTNDITHTIKATSLQEGDAVNNSDHIMLFVKWIQVNHEAEFIEEPGCSSATPYAHRVNSHVELNGSSIHVDYNGMTFTAIRYHKI